MPPKSLAGERRSQSSKRLVAENRCRSPWGLLEHLKALLCKSPHTHSGLFLGRVTSGAPLRAPAAPQPRAVTVADTRGAPRLCCCHRTAVPHRKVGSQGSTRCRLLCSCSRRAREGAGSAQSPREHRGRREHWGMWQSCAVGNPAVQPQAGAASSRAVPHAQLRSDVRTPRPCGAEECGQWKILALFVSPHQPSAHRTTPFRAVYAFQDPFMHIWQTSDTDTVQPDG